MFLGEKLRELRKLKGVKQEDVAKYCGIATSAVGHYETGRRKEPSTDLVKKFAEYFEVEFNYFYDAQPVEKDKVSQLMDELLDKEIIKDIDNIPDDIAKLILDAARMDLRLRRIKEQGN